MAQTSVRLRPPRPGDEPVVRAAHEEMLAEDFQFALGLEADTPFEEWIARLDAHRCGRDLGDWVPGTFLMAEAGGAVVGRVSVRHELNEWLANEGGHIGYGVLRQHRRRGYATEILQQALVVARAVGVDRVLVTCDDHNLGSAAVIEANGGVRDAERPLAGEAPMRRYWIE
jgi:predicted acetyltransferase